MGADPWKTQWGSVQRHVVEAASGMTVTGCSGDLRQGATHHTTAQRRRKTPTVCGPGPVK